MKYGALLILPLLGGYWFSKHWYKTAYELVRESDQLIYFKSATYGVFFLFVAIFIHFLINLIYSLFFTTLDVHHFKWALSTSISIFSLNPDPSVVWIYLISFFLGLTCHWLFAKVSNHRINKKIKKLELSWDKSFSSGDYDKIDAESDEDVKRYFLLKKSSELKYQYLKKLFQNNDFEQLVLEAFIREIPISVTMSSGKVYIGMILSEPNPSLERKSLKLLPYASGYRGSEGELIITTKYDKFYGLDFSGNEYEVTSPNDFQKVIKAEEICTVGLFDFNLYLKFNSEPGEASPASEAETK